MNDSILKWARIERLLKDARKGILEAEGMTESELRELADKALSEMTSDFLVTEWGRIQKIPDVPIQWVVRRGTQDTDLVLSKRKLKLIIS